MLKNLIYILTLKKIPILSWSSQYEFNLKPKKITIFYLIFGLILFGIGEALLITANIGVSPWFVLHQGLALKTGYTIGITTFIVSISVLLLWFPLEQKPGIGTILNAIFISVVIDLSLFILPYPKDLKYAPVPVFDIECKKNNWSCSQEHNCLSRIEVEDIIKIIKSEIKI